MAHRRMDIRRRRAGICGVAEYGHGVMRRAVFVDRDGVIKEAIVRHGKPYPQDSIEALRVCYHTDADGCACRKPKPGMLVDAAADWQVELRRSFMVGDRWRDIDAGRAAGCRTILVGGGYDERPAEGFDMRLESLLEASRWILAQGER